MDMHQHFHNSCCFRCDDQARATVSINVDAELLRLLIFEAPHPLQHADRGVTVIYSRPRLKQLGREVLVLVGSDGVNVVYPFPQSQFFTAFYHQRGID